MVKSNTTINNDNNYKAFFYNSHYQGTACDIAERLGRMKNTGLLTSGMEATYDVNAAKCGTCKACMDKTGGAFAFEKCNSKAVEKKYYKYLFNMNKHDFIGSVFTNLFQDESNITNGTPYKNAVSQNETYCGNAPVYLFYDETKWGIPENRTSKSATQCWDKDKYNNRPYFIQTFKNKKTQKYLNVLAGNLPHNLSGTQISEEINRVNIQNYPLLTLLDTNYDNENNKTISQNISPPTSLPHVCCSNSNWPYAFDKIMGFSPSDSFNVGTNNVVMNPLPLSGPGYIQSEGCPSNNEYHLPIEASFKLT